METEIATRDISRHAFHERQVFRLSLCTITSELLQYFINISKERQGCTSTAPKSNTLWSLAFHDMSEFDNSPDMQIYELSSINPSSAKEHTRTDTVHQT